MPVQEISDTIQEQVLDALRLAQTTAVEAVKTWAETVEPFVADLPSLPFLDTLPKPAEIVESAFGLAEKVLENQKEFVAQVLDAVKPVLGPKSGNGAGA